MKKTGISIAALLTAALLSACGGAETNRPSATRTTATPAPAAPPTVAELKALEVKAFEAYKNKDTKFFEAFIDRNFTDYDNGKKLDKAAMLKLVAEHKDEIKGYTFSGEQLTNVGPVTAVFTMKVATDGTRGGKKIPDVISSTLFVRQGTEWRAAWHGEVPIADPKAPAARSEGKKPAPPADGSSDSTGPLLEAEKAVWESWMKRDAETLESLTADEMSFVNIYGMHFPTREDALRDWTTDNKCDIKSFDLAGGTSVAVTGDTSLLFHTATADGTCAGKPLTGAIQGTSVYKKDGAAWRLAFTMNRPAA